MKKFLSLFLSALVVLTLLPSGALAVEIFVTSDEGVALIEEFEGYRDMPYADDQGNWYIGYGTACDPADYPDGITEEEADMLFREDLADTEEKVNGLLLDYGISVTQYQFDAMVSMTYTLGTQWMNPTYRFCSYLIQGIDNYTEAEVVNAIATWCHQGTQVLDHLVERRLREAYLFLYGEYDNAGPDDYCYIHFEPAGGEVENQTVFYPVGYAYGELPTPVWSDLTFQGWYTDDGDLLTGEEIADGNLTVTAQWSGEAPAEEEELDLSNWVNPFSDVAESDWYFTYVRELNAKGVVGGYPDGTFQAGRDLTAGEALKMILMAAGYPEQEMTDSHWASGYLALALELGCLYEGEIISLDDPITRLTVGRVAAVAMGLSPSDGTPPFADTYDGYLTALYEEGILTGTVEGRYRYYHPEESINRGEICAIVSRISSWEYEEERDPAQVGYITYRNNYYPLEREAAVAPYDSNLFVQNGSVMYYNDPGYTTAIGIDVSSHQGEIDWQQVAASGVEFALIRLGFRGYGQEGTINLDQYFVQNITGAKAAGLKVGVYFFSQAVNETEAVEEAEFVLDNLDQVGVALDYPLIYDWETVSSSSARTRNMDGDTLTDCAIAFCETVASAGYTPMIYYNNFVGYTMYDLDRLTDYDVWFAQYGVTWPTMYYDYRIWQYSDSGSIPGIETRVDMNIAFIPY